MRGTHDQNADHGDLPRFIPAYAGNAPYMQGKQVHSAVHPRVCGERPTPGEAAVIADGSSPRMRGTHRELLARAGPARFIPAYAGNAS